METDPAKEAAFWTGATVPAPDALDAARANRERLEDGLLDAGVVPTPGLLDEFEEVVETVAVTRAATLLSDVLRGVEGTRYGHAVWRVVFGPGGESLREAAERVGLSHEGLRKQEIALRSKLTGAAKGKDRQ